MAFNPGPEVAVARDAAEKLKADGVVILFIRSKAGHMGFASYGETKARCDCLGRLGEHLFDAAQMWLEDDDDG